MNFFTMKGSSGGNELDLFGYLRVIKIPSFFIKEFVRDNVQTILRDCRMARDFGIQIMSTWPP